MFKKSTHTGSAGSEFRFEAAHGGKARRRGTDLSIRDLHIAWNDLIPVPLSDDEEPLLAGSGRHGKQSPRR